MNPYIPHLLVDIKNAHRPDRPDDFFEEPKSFEEEMEIVDNYTSGTNIPPSLSHQCGLTEDQFPPENMLTEREMQIIIDAFQDMLSTRHIAADFPSGLPASRAYPLLVGLLKEEAWFFPGGMLHFDFCTGYAPDCELKEYCPCLQYWNEK
ncbi:MAG: hypothetical protein IPP15_08550 [Saprospiraceae bacterium]|uniref:Uncharacterized protein n=1 Tax=Candidatus Opimibacter skivensis TaxID=2982028 RepID=A0A9D7SVH9_9BACT|nr:hypothetical protein [Candidatus Opimibacter skivensis]